MPARKKVHENKDIYQFPLPQSYLHGRGETAFCSPALRVGNREDLADDVEINADIERGSL